MSENFEELLNQQKEVNVGDVVKAEVVQIEENQLVVSLKNGIQGAVPAREFSKQKDLDLNAEVKIGDTLELVVVKPVVGNATEEGFSFIFSKVQLAQRAAWEELAKQVGEVVDVKVTGAVRGGLTIEYGDIRGFMPGSMVSNRFVSNFGHFKGQTLEAKIIEVDVETKRFIVNRREVLLAKKAEALEKLHVGDIVTGKVIGLTDFGAFINLNGVDGLVHISEISHIRVNNPSDLLSVGEEVQVKILTIDPEDERISLSIKSTVPGPWEKIEESAPAGSILEGEVKRLTSFGAFIEVAQGVEGLIHLSEISHTHIQTPQEVLTVGEKVQVKVLSVDPEGHRISLSIKALIENKEEIQANEEEATIQEYLANQSEDKGFSLGEIAEGVGELELDEEVETEQVEKDLNELDKLDADSEASKEK